jgi:histidine triad (HIT) family protein
MPTLFTRIINGEIPGRFVWRDDRCVAFLTIEPMRPGHALVVPREEVAHWIDLEPELCAHVFEVARVIGRAQSAAFAPRRIGMMIVGEEVQHTHVHVVPINEVAELSFGAIDRSPSPESLDAAAAAIRDQLRAMGRPEVADAAG